MGNGVRHEIELHRQGVDSLVVGEAPEPFEPMQQAVLGGGHPPFFGRRVSSSEFGEAERVLVFLFFRMALTSRARLVFWVGTRKGTAALMAAFAR